MQSYSGMYISKFNFSDPGQKSLALSSVNYMTQQKLIKKSSQTTKDHYQYEHLSQSRSKENLFLEPIFAKRASIDLMKKSIHPISNYTSNTSDEEYLEKCREYKRFNYVLSEKTNIEPFSKPYYSRKSLNVKDLTGLKTSIMSRKSCTYSSNETMLPPEIKEFFRERSKQKQRLQRKKDLLEKQDITKTSHKRHPSSYGYLSHTQPQPLMSLRTNCTSKKNLQIYSSFFIKKNPSLQVNKKSEKVINDIQPLTFKTGSKVDISLSSEESLSEEENEMTARFNFSQDKINSSENRCLEPLTTSLGKKFSQQAKKQISLSNFILGSCKGKGRYGKVYLAIQRQTGFLYALKEISISVIKTMMNQFISELKIQLFFHHPYITKIYGYFIENQNIYLIMEYMTDGNLYEKIKKRGPIPQKRAATHIYQISRGLQEMHHFNVIHRDLKPQNIVMTFDVCKICDFSWATKCNERRQTNCGTLDYLSPQMISGEGYFSSIDLWATGVLLYEMLVGKPPFYNMSIKQTTKNIKQCSFKLPDSMSKSSKELIECFLRKDPDQRKQIDQILKHSFFESIEQ